MTKPQAPKGSQKWMPNASQKTVSEVEESRPVLSKLAEEHAWLWSTTLLPTETTLSCLKRFSRSRPFAMKGSNASRSGWACAYDVA